MTPEQKQIIAIVQANGGEITKAQVVQEIGRNYYYNGENHVGQRLSRMVNAGLLIRVKPGAFKLGKGTKSKPATIAGDQPTLF
jgi:hypothetical protein